ncbi:MAG: hypothetical protein GY928_06505 [Colwellia sp.]|nr:hypothetical protein [Colwellia sp.]
MIKSTTKHYKGYKLVTRKSSKDGLYYTNIFNGGFMSICETSAKLKKHSLGIAEAKIDHNDFTN